MQPTVVDTNLFVSGAIHPGGALRRLLRAWLEGRFALLLSDQQRAELIDVLERPTIARRFRLTPAELRDLYAGFTNATRVTPSPTLPVGVRDAKDEPILTAALGGGAEYLVTGDDDLLILRGDPRLDPLKIVTVGEFLALLDVR